MSNKILVVDDEDEIRELLEFDLRQSGYDVECATNGLDAVKLALLKDFDLVIMDVMMPKMNGFDACRNIKKAKPNLSVLLLTAKGTIEDKTEGFNCDADDYLVKPFEIQEVLLRTRALLRRNVNNNSELKSPEILKAGDIEIFPDSLEAVIVNKKIKLTPTEFEILYCLMQHFDNPVSLATLLMEVWGYDSDDDVRMLRVHVGTLRQKLEQDAKKPKYLHTVTNVGYKLCVFGESSNI